MRTVPQVRAKLHRHDQCVRSLRREHKVDTRGTSLDAQPLDNRRDRFLVVLHQHPFCEFVVDQPDRGQTLIGRALGVVGREIRNAGFLEAHVAPVHLLNKLCQAMGGRFLVVNDATIQVWKALESKIVNALLRIDQEDPSLLGRIGRGDAENDVLY